MSEKRILAVEIDNTLFDELDDFVKKNGLSKKQYVAEIIRANLAQSMKQEQEVAEPEITGPKGWDRPEVKKRLMILYCKTVEFHHRKNLKMKTLQQDFQNWKQKLLVKPTKRMIYELV